MDIQSDDQQTISDDQELAKALAGVTDEANAIGFGQPVSDAVQGFGQPQDIAPPQSDAAQVADDSTALAAPVPATDRPLDSQAAADPALASVKQAAITELRPLIDKLEVEPEEKFNTYLLLIRSTDDKDLIAPAHEAARAIADEAKKAQALLDIIKEIDFLSNPNQQQ